MSRMKGGSVVLSYSPAVVIKELLKVEAFPNAIGISLSRAASWHS
jgi:hypothetical protein